MAETTVRNVTLQLHVPRAGEPPTVFLVVDRGRKTEREEPLDGPTVLRALVRTHVVANLLVAHYCAALRAMLRAGTDPRAGAAGQAAKKLIEQMLGADGASATNASRGLYKPLTDPDSVGSGLGAAAESPDVAVKRNRTLDELLKKPDLIERVDVRALVSPTGRFPGCFEKSSDSESGLRAKKPWTEKRQKQLAEKVAASRPPSTGSNPLVDLKRAGWLDAGSSRRLRGVGELLGTDEGRISAELGYGTFALAAARLATNRSWRARRAEERAKQRAQIEMEFAEHFAADWWKDLDGYVAEAETRYARESGHAAKQGYRFGDGGELKGWGRIRRAWLKRRWKDGAPPSADELRQLRLAEQKLRPEEHGDHALFDWLAEPARWHLWDGRDAPSAGERSLPSFDRVGLRARHTRLSRPMKGIDFTWPDPLRHPVWMAFGEGGGPNELPWHDLRPVSDARGVTLGLLFVGSDGKLEERDVRVRIGENRRLQPAAGGSPMLDGRHQVEVGGGKLMLHRPTLDRIARALDAETRRLLVDPTNADSARIERIVDLVTSAPATRRKAGLRAYLGVALNVPVAPRPACLPLKKDTIRFNRKDAEVGFLPRHVLPAALGRPEIATSGLRVLGVDLGVRFAAAFALVQLRELGGALDRADASNRPRRVLSSAPSLVGCIERRGSLKLDGEDSDRPPPRLERAIRVVRFARRVVDRQNLVAKVRRRMDELASGNLDADAMAKERERLDRDLAALLPEIGSTTEQREARPWGAVLDDVEDALALAQHATRDALAATKAAENEALGALAAAAHDASAAPLVDAYFSALDRLAIATHRFARQAVAHPAAVQVGVAEPERRAARKRGERLPAPRIAPDSLAMGGLSVARVEFLEELLRYERKHATRSRASGDGKIRASRLSRAQPFMPSLRDRITRLKTDRCKKIAAMIVEAALGGQADVLGARKHPRADVIALEDLSRYKFFGDRSKRENRRLLAWSHREIFRWVVMQAELHGIIVAAVPAGYSSRFSATTGAPGARVETVKAEWLDAPWWKREAEDAQRNLGWRGAKAGDLVVKPGGPEFVGVGQGDHRVNADENAAANLALRFLSPPAFDPVYLRLERRDDGTYEVTTSAGDLKGVRFRRQDDGKPLFVQTASKTRKHKVADDGAPDEEAAADGESHIRVFRDPTGSVWGGGWVEDGAFWGIVRARVAKTLGITGVATEEDSA